MPKVAEDQAHQQRPARGAQGEHGRIVAAAQGNFNAAQQIAQHNYQPEGEKALRVQLEGLARVGVQVDAGGGLKLGHFLFHVRLKNLGQELHKQHHAHHPEGIGDGVADGRLRRQVARRALRRRQAGRTGERAGHQAHHQLRPHAGNGDEQRAGERPGEDDDKAQ